MSAADDRARVDARLGLLGVHMRPVGRTDVDGWCRDCCRPSCVTQLVMVTWAADPSVTVLRLLSLCGRCLGQTLTEVDDGS